MIDSLLAFLFPERCLGCTVAGTALCTNCAEHIPRADPIHDPAYAFGLFDYSNHIVRDAVWQLKYHRKSSVAKALVLHGIPDSAAFISQAMKNSHATQAVFVPIPQHYRKTFSRGFNQSHLITRWMHRLLPRIAISNILQKNTASQSQARTHTKYEREQNIHHSMQATPSSALLDPNMLYIVVDDVITTGSTIREASRALRAAGAVHITAVALAHGYAAKSALTFTIS